MRNAPAALLNSKLGGCLSREAKALLIAHLTDLHISTSASPAASRIEAIAGAIGSQIEGPTVVVLAITGDIAFAGTAEQYEAASSAIQVLLDRLSAWSPVDVLVAACPGNHDCNFKASAQVVRDTLVSGLAAAPEDVAPLLDALRPWQADFSAFADKVSSGRLQYVNPVLSVARLELPSISFKFVALNTALCSRLKEQPGSLRLPAAALAKVERDADCCIVLAHHPLNWLDPQDAVAVSDWLDSSADMVLWGHEHRLDEFELARARTGSSVIYQIGKPLDDPTVEEVGFKLLRIEDETREVATFDVQIHRAETRVVATGSGQLHLNAGRHRGTIRFSGAHNSFLNDPGAAFTHPRVSRDMRLSDLFVAPDFREFRSDKNEGERTDGSFALEELCRHIANTKSKTIVFGAEQSGKTTFAKHLIQWLRPRELIPIFLDGEALRSTSRGEIRGWFNSAVASQFERDAQDAVFAAEPATLVAIVDNVHSMRGGREGVERILEFVSSKCGKILLLTADSPALSVLAVGAAGEECAYWKGGTVFELLPLGHRRRGELIRRWVSIGRDSVDDAALIEAEVRQIKVLLDKLLGKDSLPKHPLFVLIVLQQLEGMRENRTAIANGSHGYLFEALISQAIDKHVRSHEIGTVNDFLAALSFEIWNRDTPGLSEGAVSAVIQRFLEGLVRIDGDQLLAELDRGRVLAREGGLYRFRYNYVYFYYLAKWACSKQNRDESDRVLDRLAQLVHTELSSNVLMFVAHLQHEQRVIDRLLPLIRGLYPEQKERLKSLEAYSPLSVRFRTAQQRATLLEGNARAVSDETHAHEDQSDKNLTHGSEDAEIEDGLKFNATLKAIHALGQVLKSRASSVSPEVKIEIADEIILVSRRLMGFLYELTGTHAEGIVRAVSDAFEHAFKMDRQQAVDIANSLIGAIVSGIARTCVARAAEAISSSELVPLLDKMDGKLDDQDSKLILLVAKVNGERDYPKEAVEDFLIDVKPANVLPRSVLSYVVARRFYLDPPERGIRDSACATLGIDVKNVPERSKGLGRLKRRGPA